MNANLDNIAEELFGKIRTRFPKIDLGDKEGKIIENHEDVKSARFFDFDYVKEGVSLGSVSIKLSDKDGLVVMYSNDIAEGQPQPVVNEWYGFLKSLREFARRRLLNYDTRDLVKSNLDKRDYNFLATNSGEGQMTESKLWGTNRTSFQDVGEAKIIVKHSQNVNFDNPAGRTLHIESIFIENAEGERFKYPYKHLNGARALAQHVAHGGTPYDTIGEHVIGLSEELSKLRFFKGYVSRQDQISEAMGSVTEKVIERIDQVKKEIHQLQSATHYKSFVESFAQSEAEQIPEDIVNDWVDKLTIRNFNEALKDVFPYIYKLVGEGSTVTALTPDDLLGEEKDEKCSDCHKPVDDCECDDHDHDEDGKKIKEFVDFEMTLENLLSEDEGIASSDEQVKGAAVEKLNQFLSTNPKVGTDGTNAVMSLKDVITDSKFINALKDLPGETELAPVIKGYLETEHPDLVDMVTFPTPGQPSEPAPPAAPDAGVGAATPAPAAPATGTAAPEQGTPMPAEQPVAAESRSPVQRKMEAVINRARKAGMTSQDVVEIAGQKYTLAQIAERAGVKLTPHPKEIVEFIKSFYDKEHGTFPKGETGVLIATEKKFGEEAKPIAHRVIETLSQISEQFRMRKLAGLKHDTMAFESLTYEKIMLEAGDPAIMKMQQDLIAKGAKIKADGIMGPATQAAMQQFSVTPPKATNAATLKAAQTAAGNATTPKQPAPMPGQSTSKFAAKDPRRLDKKPQSGQPATPAAPAAPAADTPIGAGSGPQNAAATMQAAQQGASPTQAAAAGAAAMNAPTPTASQVDRPQQSTISGAQVDPDANTAQAEPAAPAAPEEPSAGQAAVNQTNTGVLAALQQGGASSAGGTGNYALAQEPEGQAAQPAAEPAAPAAPPPVSTVRPDVKSPTSGETWKDGSGNAIKSRSDLEIAWSNMTGNRGKQYPGDAVAQQQVAAQQAAGQKNLDAVKGLWNKITGQKPAAPAPASESVTFANDELTRLMSLVKHK